MADTIITLTGNNNYSGTYDLTTDYSNFWVLGGASDGNHNDTDINTGNEVFVFGNLSQRSTTITDASYDSTGTAVTATGTYNTTATGTAADTLHFGFTFHQATGGTSNFLTTYAPQDYSPDTDGDANYQAQSNVNAWNTNYLAWQASLPAGTTYSDPTTIETSVTPNNPHPDQNDPDVNITLNITATTPGGPASLTADHTGAKVLLGFGVDSDHIVLDNITSETMFSNYFTVASTTHISANSNVVNDTTISLNGGGWSVDLYGVDTHLLAGQNLIDFAWNHIISHA